MQGFVPQGGNRALEAVERECGSDRRAAMVITDGDDEANWETNARTVLTLKVWRSVETACGGHHVRIHTYIYTGWVKTQLEGPGEASRRSELML